MMNIKDYEFWFVAGSQHLYGESAQPHYMTDIAATVCAMLHIQAPNGCIGTPIF